MKTYLLPIFALLIIGCGNQHSRQETTTQSIETEITDSMAEKATAQNNIEVLQDSMSNVVNGKSLNDIRFGNWTKKDWYDNEYFRTLRKYIDSCYKGDIEDEHLEPYKSVLKGKFVIGNVEPYILGGLFITIIFIDAPDKLFDARVYSYVEEESEEITGYEVRGLRIREDEESGLSKNEILAIIKEHPENKLW